MSKVIEEENKFNSQKQRAKSRKKSKSRNFLNIHKAENDTIVLG